MVPVLLRFAKTDYYVSRAKFNLAEEGFNYSNEIYNGYVAQETLFFNFDVLSMEFQSKDGYTATVVGVVADSIDIINGLTAPENIIVEEAPWWLKIMFLLILILVLDVLSIIFPGFKAVLDVIWFVIKTLFIWLIKLVSALINLILSPFRLLFDLLTK